MGLFILHRRGSSPRRISSPSSSTCWHSRSASTSSPSRSSGSSLDATSRSPPAAVFLTSRGAPVRLAGAGRRGMAGVGRRVPGPLLRPLVGRPPVPVPDGLLRLGRRAGSGRSWRSTRGSPWGRDRDGVARRGSPVLRHVGVPFVVCRVVDLALTRERFRRAFVVVIPPPCRTIWYLRWGREAETFVSFHNFQTFPGYGVDGSQSSLSSLLGLGVLTRRDDDHARSTGAGPCWCRDRASRSGGSLGRGSRRCRGVSGLWLPGSWCSGP